MKKETILLSILLAFYFSNLSSQVLLTGDNPFKATCKLLNQNNWTTDHLADQTWTLNMMELLKGTPNDTLNAVVFEQLFFDLKLTERAAGSMLPSQAILEDRINQYRNNRQVPIGLILQPYNYILPNAFADDLLILENHLFKENPNVQGQIYGEALTFAMTPLVTGTAWRQGEPTQYIIPSDQGERKVFFIIC